MSLPNVLTVLAILSFIIFMKVLICGCFLRRRQRNRNEDTLPILEEAAERLQEIHQQRIRSRRAREPPPDFDDALRNSRPVSYIDIDEPPPSYDEYLKSNGCKDFMEFTSSVNPSDVVIPLDVTRSSIDLATNESNA